MSDRDLERAVDRFTDVLHEAIAVRVQQALALERDRSDAALAELRDEIADVAKLGGGTRANEEIRYLNERMEKLTQTVAAMMDDDAHSVRVAR